MRARPEDMAENELACKLEGSVKKQNQSLPKNWKDVFIQLGESATGPLIQYTDPGKKSKKPVKFPLNDATSVETEGGSVFIIKDHGKEALRIKVGASSKTSRDEWVSGIQQVLREAAAPAITPHRALNPPQEDFFGDSFWKAIGAEMKRSDAKDAPQTPQAPAAPADPNELLATMVSALMETAQAAREEREQERAYRNQESYQNWAERQQERDERRAMLEHINKLNDDKNKLYDDKNKLYEMVIDDQKKQIESLMTLLTMTKQGRTQK